MSASGALLVARGESLAVSTDAGATWAARLGAPPATAGRMAVSADGALITVGAQGALWVSSDAGVSWASRAAADLTSGAAAFILFPAISAEPNRALCALADAGVYVGMSDGTQWREASPVDARGAAWEDVACDAGGCFVLAASGRLSRYRYT